MRLLPRLILHTGAVAVFATAALVPAVGQRRPPSSPVPREEREREQHERLQALNEMQVRALGTAPEREDPRLDVLQIAEDFRLLQLTARELNEAASQGGALDLKVVAKSASEIRKRAARLGSNLALPKPEREDRRPKPAVPADHEGLMRRLAELDRSIYQFASNPVFSQANVVDAELSLKARRDLDEIIELSGLVKEGCKGLGKAARRPQ